MFLMEYTSMRGEDFQDDSKQATWKLLCAYIDTHSQSLIDYYSEGGVQAITRFQSQCTNKNFSGNSRYNRLFQQMVHKVGDSEINYINIL